VQEPSPENVHIIGTTRVPEIEERPLRATMVVLDLAGPEGPAPVERRFWRPVSATVALLAETVTIIGLQSTGAHVIVVLPGEPIVGGPAVREENPLVPTPPRLKHVLRIDIMRVHGAWYAQASSSLMGETDEEVGLPDIGDLRPGDQRAIGRRLYDSLIVGSIRTAMEANRNAARRHHARLAVQLRFNSGAVAFARMPWELLHDGDSFLLLDGVDLTRYILLPRPASSIQCEPPLRIALVAASPVDQDPLDLRSATTRLRRLPNVTVDRVKPPTYNALLTKLGPHRGPFHVFDFEGHGAVCGEDFSLCFEDKARETDPIGPQDLWVALSTQHIALAMINACHSAEVDGSCIFNGIAPSLVLAGVPAVIGMQGCISDEGANHFLEAFYNAIADNIPLATAVAGARRFLYRSGEWSLPVLYLRSSDEEGRILVCPAADETTGRSAELGQLAAAGAGAGASDPCARNRTESSTSWTT